MPDTYASFLVRLWCDPGAGWCAEIEHVQSGKSRTFGNVGEALDFLRQQTEDKQLSELDPATPAEAGSGDTTRGG